jgi:Bacterial Ig-like domain (group 3)
MRSFAKMAIIVVGLLGAALTGSAQTDQSSPKTQPSQPSHLHAPGKHALQGVHVPFNPGLKDAEGRVIPATPDLSKFEGMEEGPSLSEQGLADKARAEAGEFKNLIKPAPRFVPDSKANFLQKLPLGVSGPVGKRNTWKLGEDTSERGKQKNAADAPSLSNSFEGVGDTGTEPPDVASAAGPYQIVATSNFVVNTFDKNGNLQSSQDFSSFFSPLGNPSTWFLFDPIVQYDPYIGRFWLIVSAQNTSTNQSDILIGLSADSDVRFGWIEWWVDMTQDGTNATSNWCDYPHLGYDTNAIYMTCNQFQFGGGFQYAKIRMMLKNQFLNNTCCQWYDHWNLKEGFLNTSTSFTVQPAVMRLAPGTSGEFFADSQGGGGSGSTLQIWQIPDPVNNPQTLNSSSIGITNYAPAPAATQPFGVTGIDTGDARLLFATYEFGHLSVGQNSSCGSNSCSAFYELNVSGFPNLSTVNDWALQASGVDYYYPGVDQNFSANKTMVYTRSSVGEYAGSNYVGIPNSGSCTGCITGPETSLAAGQNTYSRICCGNRNRWGDYFTASEDPDGLGIWISGEFVQSQNSWATQVAATYNGYAPFGTLSFAPFAFGAQAVFSSTSPTAEFINNTGNASMILGGVSLTGDSNFSISFDGCSFQLIQPGNNCEVDFVFRPTSVGAHSATFTAPYNTFFEVQTSVTGTGVQAGSFTSLSSTPDPSTFGQAVKFTAVVTPQTSGTPTGSVTFKNGATSLGTATLSGGVASLSTAVLSGGNHTITAVYSGNTNYLSSSGAVTQTVKPAVSLTTITSSLNPSTYGKSVTFTALVKSAIAGTITGTVTFKDGAASLGSATIVSGKATLATTALTGGTHSITATYNGSANYAVSTSSALSEKVNKATTTTTITAGPNPSSFGQTVKLTATVKSGSLHGAGSVTFKRGATALGTATLSATGVGTLSITTLPVGTDPITAVYAGNTNFLTSTSTAVSEVVNKAKTTTTLASSANPATHGTTVTFTATVKPAFTGSATGTVTFKDGATVLGTAGVSTTTHQAKFGTSKLAVGTHKITAVYGGGNNFLTSTSTVLSQVIK